MRRFFEAKAPRDPTSSSDSDSSASRSSVIMSGSKSGGGGRSHSRSHHHAHHGGGGKQPPAMTFTTNSSVLGTTTTTIISKNGGGGGGASTPSSIATTNATTVVEASSSSAGTAAAPPPSALDGKTHKKCSVCGKSFNPLRRRHYCRTCTAVVCSSCSISRKVESTFEGAITVRMCVSCKLSAIASQDDFYDRIFASGSGVSGPASSGLGGAPPSDGFNGSERLSVASYASNSNTSSAGAPVDQTTPLDKRAASASSLTGGAISSNQPPALRRKSSAVSNTRRDSLGSNSNANASGLPFDDDASSSNSSSMCPLCHNEACAPIREYADVPYPFFLELADPNAGAKSNSPQFVAAKPLDSEKDRLRSVRALRNALKLSTVPGSQTTLNQLCSMAAIATSSPLALVGLLDKHVYAPVAETGVGNLDKIDRHKSLAAHTCRNGGPLVCSELARDVRFAANPWARESLRAGFYAGIPLTLSNGHIVGAVEVFDVKPRYACMDVVAQLQAVVRGLQRKLDEIYAKAPTVGDEYLDGRAPVRPVVTPGSSSNGQRRADSVDSSHSSHSSHHSSHNSKRSATAGARPPPPSAPAAPPIPPPKKIPSPVQEPAKERPAPPSLPAASEATSAAPAAANGQEQAPQGDAPANEMEMRLMELLSQTTSTQEQLRNQQSNMVVAISSHSKQIGELAKQLQRIETTLASKLGGDADKEGAGEDQEEVEAEVPPATAAA